VLLTSDGDGPLELFRSSETARHLPSGFVFFSSNFHIDTYVACSCPLLLGARDADDRTSLEPIS
jgi:hypothetical protein